MNWEAKFDLDPGWLAEFIEQDSCGAVVAPGDSNQFAAKLIEMRGNGHGKEIMERFARELAVSSFNHEQLVNKFVDVLEGINTVTVPLKQGNRFYEDI